MKIEPKKNSKTPAYAAVASMLAASTLISGCIPKPQISGFLTNLDPSSTEDVAYAGDEQVITPMPTDDLQIEGDVMICDDGYVTEDDFDNYICSIDEANAWMEGKRIPLFKNLVCESGEEYWDEFYIAAKEGFSTSVFCAKSYVPEKGDKDDAPALYFYFLSFDGETYHVKVRDCSKKELDSEKDYSCLLHFDVDNPEGAQYAHYDVYVLANDASLTWEDIERSNFSSQSTDLIDHMVIYSNMYD